MWFYIRTEKNEDVLRKVVESFLRKIDFDN